MMKKKTTRKNVSESGITLIALVVTIVVMLILAGITISLVFSDNGIIAKARMATEKSNQAAINEQAILNDFYNDVSNVINSVTPAGPTIPEGLEIGSTVSYNPSGTYNWQAQYASSDQASPTNDVPLNSGTGEDFNISSWKVLSIDEATGEVKLVPSAQTTGTVRLQGPQGYNNAVKLLNDACNELYGDDAKGITARSINIDDIEGYMTDAALEEAHSYSGDAQYGNQISSAYSSSNSRYPAIYAQEKLAVINGTANGEERLGLSEQTTFIERSEGANGAITTATNIQPYQTYWYKDSTFMSTAFKDYKEGANYYNLIMPSGTSTTYWMASRCVHTGSDNCTFIVSIVTSGNVSAYDMYLSNGNPRNDSRALFPVVTLSSELISGNSSSGYSVN